MRIISYFAFLCAESKVIEYQNNLRWCSKHYFFQKSIILNTVKANVAENVNKITDGSIRLLKKAGSWLRSVLPTEAAETDLNDYTNISTEPITLRLGYFP